MPHAMLVRAVNILGTVVLDLASSAHQVVLVEVLVVETVIIITIITKHQHMNVD